MSFSVQASTLVAYFERIPNQEAIERAPTTGWIMLALAACAAIIFIINREGWRRLWSRAEDPRAMALFRIVFGICAMCNINGLWEMFEYLFTDEGIFLTDVARQCFARDQFRGFGNGLDGDPYGFFDVRAVFEFLKGPKYSLLFFWDSPTAWWIHWAVWQAAMLCLIFGFKTRYTKWIAWFLFHSIIQRNSIYWEGTENVYRTFFFYLCLSRCGHAYSIDNWLRCRKLRKQGFLSTRDGPGDGAGVPPSEEHPKGLQAIYRRIPAWPRLLVILQVAAMYCYTGVVKNGSVWWKGDAFYYALNLDHFYRIPPQQLSAWFGTNLFRVNTMVVHFWESFFPIVVFGLIVRFGLRERLPPLTKGARWAHRGAWVALGLGTLALVQWLYPVHWAQPKNSIWTLERVQWAIGIAWILGMVLVGWGWYRLRYRPFEITIRSRKRVIDLDAFLKWTVGRRIWVLLGFVFQLHLLLLMNIGWFQLGALSGFLCYLNGSEVATFGLMLWRMLVRLKVPGISKTIPKSPTPPEDPRLPHLHRDAVRLPVGALVIALCMVLGGVVLHYGDVVHFGWVLLGVFVFLAGAMLQASRGPERKQELEIVDDPYRGTPTRPDQKLRHDQLTTPWAYGPMGRFLSTCLVLYQVVGVACWLLPDKDSFRWRTHTHEPFKWWLRVTQTTQGWKMFAPNPPRGNRFLQVLVTDKDGEVWDMNTDVYAPEQYPIPWIFYTRWRKVNRRISGAEGGHGSWYQKWHARYFCRKWALEHGGELPEKVELVKITYGIPSPEWVKEHGPYDPMERLEKYGKSQSLYTAECLEEVDGQVPNVIRARHGLPQADHEIRRWSMLRNRQKAWERWLEQERKKQERKAEKD